MSAKRPLTSARVIIECNKTFAKLYSELRYRQIIAINGDDVTLRGIFHPVHKSQIERWTNK